MQLFHILFSCWVTKRLIFKYFVLVSRNGSERQASWKCKTFCVAMFFECDICKFVNSTPKRGGTLVKNNFDINETVTTCK